MKIHTIGGYNEVGKNMTIVELADDAVIFDSGFYMPAIVEMQEDEGPQQAYTEKKLRNSGALPDDILVQKLGLRNKNQTIQNNTNQTQDQDNKATDNQKKAVYAITHTKDGKTWVQNKLFDELPCPIAELTFQQASDFIEEFGV